MTLSDINVIVPIVAGIITDGATTIGLAYRIGKKSGEIQQKLKGLSKEVKEDKERITYIERIFMNNSP